MFQKKKKTLTAHTDCAFKFSLETPFRKKLGEKICLSQKTKQNGNINLQLCDKNTWGPPKCFEYAC